jgi:SAM-dependent methyltransferase
MLAAARRRCQRSSLVHGDLLTENPLGARKFEIVTAFRFFVNVEPELRRPALRALRNHLAADGVLIANVHGNSRSLRHLSVAIRRRWPSRATEPDMLNEMSAADFKALCDDAGLVVQEVHGYGMCPPGLYRTALRPIARRIDDWLANSRLARLAGVDLVFVCRPPVPGNGRTSTIDSSPTSGHTAIAGGDTAEPRNVRKRVDVINQHLPAGTDRILDGGCGRGGYVRAMRAATGARTVGVEYQAAKLQDGLVDGVRGAVVRGDLEHLAISDDSFDAVLLNEVLEHVPSDQRALEEVHRVVRPGGRVVVMSPNRVYPFESHGVFLKRSGRPVPVFVPFVPYIPLPLGRRLLRYWARNYWPHELRDLVTQAGFRVVHTGFVWQTFEGISGHQPRLVRALLPFARAASGILERVPGVRRLGISQLVVGEVDRG